MLIFCSFLLHKKFSRIRWGKYFVEISALGQKAFLSQSHCSVLSVKKQRHQVQHFLERNSFLEIFPMILVLTQVARVVMFVTQDRVLTSGICESNYTR